MDSEKNRIKEFNLVNNAGMKVCILNYGGTIRNIMVPDRDLQMGDVVLGFDTNEEYLQKENPFFGCVAGRYANRIAGGRFTIDGKNFQVSVNDGKNTLHGGKVGLNRKFWDADFDSGSNTVQLSYVSPDGDEGFPGALSVTMQYSLNEENEIRIDYKATTDLPTPVNLTNHSYFNLSAGRDVTVEAHEIMFNAGRYIPVDGDFLPLGSIEPVENTPMDFRSLEKIGKDLHQVPGGFDHTMVIDTESAGIPRYAASVLHPESGRYMEVFTTQPGVQFYTGNFLDGSLTGKGGARYVRNAGFCLETQHFPDSPNHPSFPNTILRPGELFHEITVYRFSTR